MKKMMFALACASTLALVAEGEEGAPTVGSMVDFERYEANFTGLTAKDDFGSGSATDSYWLYAAVSGATDGSTVKAYDPSIEGNTQYLDLSTEGGTLWRSVNKLADAETLGTAQTVPAGGLFIDTMVQFTPTEDGGAPELGAGDKLAIWLNVDSSGATPVTNLCVRAGFLDDNGTSSSCTPKTYVLTGAGDINPSTWYRLKVKSIADSTKCMAKNLEAYPSGYLGFQIYLDGKLLSATEATIGEGYVGLALDAGEYGWLDETADAETIELMQSKTLFPCLLGAETTASLQAVGFKGSGAIDDLTISDKDPGAAPEGEGWPKDLKGLGTAEAPYQIANAADFAKFAEGVATGGENYPTEGIHFALTGNITLTGTASPIGAGANKDNVSTAAAKDTYIATAFKGTFDGQGNTISGLVLPREDYTGLFGSTYGATIKNLKVECAGFENDESVANYGGAILVGTSVDTTIENCEVSGTVTATKAIAGFVGYGASGTVVKGCVNKANLETANEKVAGMIACAQKGSGVFGDVGVTVDGCTNEGNLTCSTSGKTYLGGLVSYADSLVTLKGANEVKGTLTQVGGSVSSLVAPNSGSVAVDADATFTVPADMRTVTKASVDGIQLGLVSDGVATLVKAADVEAGKTYKVMAGTPAPVIALARGESITFQGAIDATGITAADAADQVTVADGVYTCSQIPVPLTGIALSQTTASVECDKTVTLTVTYTPENTTDDKTVVWSVEGDAATVENGVVTGVKPGTATVTATVGDKTASCTVTVTAIAVTPEVTLSDETAEFSADLALPTVTVAGDYVKDTDYTVAWDKELPTENPTENVVLTVTVAMKGNYTGSATKTFTVTPKTAAYPTYIETDAEKAKYDEWAKTNGADADSSKEAQYLLNVAPSADATIAIEAIEQVEGGWKITVSSAAQADLSQINGSLVVKTATTLGGAWTAQTIKPTFAAGKATITVPAGDAKFMKAAVTK